MRILEQKKVWILTNEVYKIAVDMIHMAISQLTKFDAVIGIRNGGQHLGRDLAKIEGIPFYFVEAFYNATNAPYSNTLPSVSIVSSDITGLPEKLNILLVDDISGTGNTVVKVRDFVNQLIAPSSIVTVTLCRNEGCSLTPDLFVWSTRDWVIFPWEPIYEEMESDVLRVPDSLSGELSRKNNT